MLCYAVCRRFVSSFIDFPRPLAAVVNGPAVGVSVTVLGLFDVVYATDKVTYVHTFSQCNLVILRLKHGCIL